MGTAGSVVAVETADIALMGDNVLKLPEAIFLARRTVANMRQNIAIALITVSLLMLGVLLGGVTMAIGMLVHEVCVLVVIVNAMRLGRKHDHNTPTAHPGFYHRPAAAPSARLSLRQRLAEASERTRVLAAANGRGLYRPPSRDSLTPSPSLGVPRLALRSQVHGQHE
jgi:hypothetical protein